jgi:CTP synthase
VARSEKEIEEKRKEKLAFFCNLNEENIISNPDVESVYVLPEHFKKQKFDEKILKKLGLKIKSETGDLKKWNKFVECKKTAKKPVKIAMVGKYFATGDYKLTDSYISVIEAIKQAAWTVGVILEL